MPNLTLILTIITVFLLGSTLTFYFLFSQRSKKVERMKLAFEKLKASFNKLDDQAKIIAKTDLALNKTQEELDHRLSGLDALQKTSRLISTTLDENEIFHRLEQSLMLDLGFEKNIIFIQDENKILNPRVSLGFSQSDTDFILQNLNKNDVLMKELAEGQTFSSANSTQQRKETIRQTFDIEHFVISPILTQNGFIGILFVGNRSNASSVTEGDEELISILANQMGQSVENARLFEQVFRARQDLEVKIQDRTKQLADALEDVKLISKTKSEFISAVSHELRTPLTSIKGYAAILKTGKLGEIPEKVKERLEKINIHSDNLVKLINDLLDISRIESGRVEMNIGRCDVKKIIENVEDLLTPQMKEKNIQWVADVDASIPEMLLDSSQIERVFINLVSNAIKFTPENGMISIKAKRDDDIINVKVTDTGIGISEEDIRKLFDEFYRVENKINQNVKGTGLGLPLAKKIVEAHDGKMWVTSEVNFGTTFHFTLPIEIKEPTIQTDDHK